MDWSFHSVRGTSAHYWLGVVEQEQEGFTKAASLVKPNKVEH